MSLIRQQIENELAPSLGFKGWKIKAVLGTLTLLLIAGIIAYVIQVKEGLVVTAMRDYVSWGLYISMFIFFIGISHVGALMSAILRLTGADWRYPITRMAEAITFSSLLFAGIMPILDMGRPDRIMNLLFHGRIQSPIVWDVLAISTYFAGSAIFLYLPMIPDIARLRDSAGVPKWRKRIYSFMSAGWKEHEGQYGLLEKGMDIMTPIILPVAISVHTVVSWLFAMTLRPGWNSTIFGPYFVSGAIVSGCAAVIIAMACFRKAYSLENYITKIHFRNLSLLLFVLALIYLYFNLNEYLVPAFKMEEGESGLLHDLFHGSYAPVYWTVQVAGLFIPTFMLAFSAIRKSITLTVVASVLIVAGAVVKRYLIVIPTMLHPFIDIPLENTPEGWSNYLPSAIEWLVTAGCFAGFILVYILFSRIFPIVTIWETSKGIEEKGADAVGVNSEIFPETKKENIISHGSIKVTAVVFVLFTASFQSFAQKSNAVINLKERKDNAGIFIEALITQQQTGKPLQNVDLSFYAKRTFGLLPLGDVTSDSVGKAGIQISRKFPPGDTLGNIKIIARIEDSDIVKDTSAYTIIQSEIRFPSRTPFPRSVWAPHAPLWLIATFILLLGGVWITYAYVIKTIINIKKTES
ncbi:MAG: polysulfide reductase NrfD [Cytophagaceae bacterium]|nr:polysulfide reductase NrfD [Cytophagaceae bacterium]